MPTTVRRFLLSVSTALVLVACSTAGSSTGPGAASPGSSPGGSADQPVGTEPGGIGAFPNFPPPIGVRPGENPKAVIPRPGRLNVHPVGAMRIEARLDGRHLFVRLTWWSGVEPCSVLDSVGVDTSGTDIVLTIREGADRLDVACIEIALLKSTIVDLGELEPGTYTISAGGDATPIQVTVG